MLDNENGGELVKILYDGEKLYNIVLMICALLSFYLNSMHHGHGESLVKSVIGGDYYVSW
jgi:hypothetical protein